MKLGDMVEVVSPSSRHIPAGTRGYVRYIRNESIGVDFGEGFEGHRLPRSGKIHISTPTGWFMLSHELKLTKQQCVKDFIEKNL